MSESVFCLNPQYSTARMVIKEQPMIENYLASKVQTQLFLPSHSKRKGEGGLRTKSYFKRSFYDKPLVSVISVVFNGHERLEKTIQTVINQTYENLEYIIIDGGSMDGTSDIIKKYEHAVDYWVSEPDTGIYDAMNKGIDTSSGEYIYFLNAGDYFFNNKVIESIIKKAIVANYPDLIWGNVVTQNGVKYFDTFASKKDFLTKTISHQAVFSHRRTIEPFNIKYKISADYDFLLKVFSKKKVTVYVNEIISFYDSVKDDKNKKERFLYDYNRSMEKRDIVIKHYTGLCKILSFLYFTLNSFKWKFKYWVNK